MLYNKSKDSSLRKRGSFRPLRIDSHPANLKPQKTKWIVLVEKGQAPARPIRRPYEKNYLSRKMAAGIPAARVERNSSLLVGAGGHYPLALQPVI